MKNVKWLIAAGLLSLSLISLSHAVPNGPGCDKQAHKAMPHHKGGMHKGPMMGKPGPMHMFLQLNLDETQYQRISELFDAEHAVMRSKHEKRMALIEQLYQVANQKTFDASRANTLASQMGALEKEIAVSKVKTGHRAYNLLTVAQQKQFNQMIKERKERGLKHKRPVHGMDGHFNEPAQHAKLKI